MEADVSRRLRAPLLRWYRRHKRDLPWRKTKDPYAIWVSEVMLQQTTVAAVVPYWERFMTAFPDVPSLARASEQDVLAAWSGLGYYRRARSLRDGASVVMEQHGGTVPSSLDDLRALPGIGRYTAGAIASMAFGNAAPVVDGNVKRVFARLLGLRRVTGARTEKTMWELAATLVAGTAPGDLNQALMELGATVCTPRAPRCDLCPIARACRARESGAPEAFPTPVPRATPRRISVAAAWIVRDGAVLLERRHAGGILRGSWDVPAVAVDPGGSPRREIAKALAARHGVRIRVGERVARLTHAILDTRLDLCVFEASVPGRAPRRAALRLAPLDALASVAHSGATRKIARALADPAQKRSHVSPSLDSAGAGSSSGARRRSNA